MRAENNKVELTGTIISEPEFNHEVFGEGFYNMYLKVDRLSGTADITVAYVTDYIEKNPDDTNYRYIPKYGDWLKEDCDYWIRQVEKRKRGESS